MSKSAMIHARVEPKIKENVEDIFSELGLNMTSAINLFFKQVILNNGLPFRVNIPNEKTRLAIEEVRKNMKSNKKARFKSASDLLDSLED